MKQVYTCENGAQLCYGDEWRADLKADGTLLHKAEDKCPNCGEKGMARERVTE